MTCTRSKEAVHKRASRAILMVGPIPAAGSYVGGIGISLRRLLDHWSLPVPVVHLNTESSRRACGARGRMRVANCVRATVHFIRLTWWTVRLHPLLVHYHTSRGIAFLKDMLCAGWVRNVLRHKTILHVRSSDIATILIGRSARLRQVQIRALLRCCDRIVFLSKNVLNDFAAAVGGKTAARLRARSVVIPNFTLMREKCRQHDESVGCANLFFIGNVGLKKGAQDIVSAARLLRERTSSPFRVVFAGPFATDQDERLIRGMVTESGLSDTTVFCGPVSGQKKESLFLESDVFLLPSYSEGMPQSMLEAMAYGLPVVVSNVGGIPEVVQDGVEGYVVAPGDVSALFCAMEQLIESVERRREMGNAGRRRIADHHTLDGYMRQLEELYESVLQSVPLPAPSRVVR